MRGGCCQSPQRGRVRRSGCRKKKKNFLASSQRAWTRKDIPSTGVKSTTTTTKTSHRRCIGGGLHCFVVLHMILIVSSSLKVFEKSCVLLSSEKMNVADCCRLPFEKKRTKDEWVRVADYTRQTLAERNVMLCLAGGVS